MRVKNLVLVVDFEVGDSKDSCCNQSQEDHNTKTGRFSLLHHQAYKHYLGIIVNMKVEHGINSLSAID